ncbi:hypothetical protein FSP39_024812, partial [Pinctada imbricata]
LIQNSTAFANLSNITLHPHDTPKTPTEYIQRFAPLSLTIDRVISPIWYVIGLIGNPITVRIWLCMCKKNSSAVYVGSLAIVHTLFLLLHITMELQVIIEIRKLKSRSPVVTLQNQDSGSSNPTSTVTLLFVSFYLICTLLPASVVYTLQALLPKGNETLTMTEMDTDPTWQTYFTYLTIRKIVEEMCLSNFACYFLIYYFTGQCFRKEVKKLFGCSRKCFHNKKQKDSTTSPGKRSEYTLVSSNGKTACDYQSTLM